jgi:serine protein kinase
MSDAAPFDASAWLTKTSTQLRESFETKRRVMSFGEYFTLFCAQMAGQTRSTAQYLLDAMDHYGTETVRSPRGPVTRWKLFDCPFDEGKDHLIGQEEVQGAIYRLVSNFAREGRTTRLILLHGPNGSAKSTLVTCLQRALEHYSSLDEGALYRFNWIFPSQRVSRSGIGFSGTAAESVAALDSYAMLDDELIEAKIVDELRDHPMLLLPRETRRALFEERLTPAVNPAVNDGFRPARQLLGGDLSHRNRQIFEALLSSYHGDITKVLRHVQVERFFVSRRYRQAVATVEPQMAVDARSRQLTMDRSLSSLPPALQSLTLYEVQGELVDGNRGILDFADLLKRPLEAFKYLLGTVEQGRVTLDVAVLEVDTVFLASSNEGYLSAFKEVPEFQSFKGRMELVRAPYLLDYRQEIKIYEAHIEAFASADTEKHVAPHVAWATALWAVLTRMRKPMPEKYPKPLAELMARLGPLDKALLYAGESPADGFSVEQQKDLAAGLERVARESDSYPNYEGRMGASPREMKLLLMNAAQSPKWRCLSPFAVLEELEDLVKGVSLYEFLKQEPLAGGYHENRKFIFQVRDRLIDIIDDEVRTSMGLVDERRYIDQFERYVSHASHWIKREKVRNPVTGKNEDPDEELMSEVERMLEVGSGDGKREDFRREVISKIGAWSLDNPRRKPDYELIFPRPIANLREAFFSERKKQIRKNNEDLLVYLVDGPSKMLPDVAEASQRTIETLKSRFQYCDHCAKDAILALVRKRYS